MTQGRSQEQLFETIRATLQPDRPVRSVELLRGREAEYAKMLRELQHFDGIPFIFGPRGVGKTSLARTAAQAATKSDREHIYVACAPKSKMLEIFREVGEQMLSLAIKFRRSRKRVDKVEVEISTNPAIRASIENEKPELEKFRDVNAAVRVLKSLDDILQSARETVVVIDELEELNKEDRNALAFLIKQIGDQEFATRFLLVGIAENVHELIGTHESVPRYLTEIPLDPLIAQDLMDIVSNAADKLNIEVDRDTLCRIAIIGNGFPYYAHLIGKTMLVEAVLNNETEIFAETFKKAIKEAISQSLQELKISYEAAVQRGADHYKHMLWALADFNVVDIRIDDWRERYKRLAEKNRWPTIDDKKFTYASGNLQKESYGNIIRMTPAKYGSTKKRYRHKRFLNPLMKGYIRLQAESEEVQLGQGLPL